MCFLPVQVDFGQDFCCPRDPTGFHLLITSDSTHLLVGGLVIRVQQAGGFSKSCTSGRHVDANLAGKSHKIKVGRSRLFERSSLV